MGRHWPEIPGLSMGQHGLQEGVGHGKRTEREKYPGAAVHFQPEEERGNIAQGHQDGESYPAPADTKTDRTGAPAFLGIEGMVPDIVYNKDIRHQSANRQAEHENFHRQGLKGETPVCSGSIMRRGLNIVGADFGNDPEHDEKKRFGKTESGVWPWSSGVAETCEYADGADHKDWEAADGEEIGTGQGRKSETEEDGGSQGGKS